MTKLSKVDLPALGRPINATTPDLRSPGSRCCDKDWSSASSAIIHASPQAAFASVRSDQDDKHCGLQQAVSGAGKSAPRRGETSQLDQFLNSRPGLPLLR